MEARDESDGSLALTYDGTPLAKGLAGIAAVLVATAIYDSFIGSRGSDRLIGLLAGAGTCAAAALALLEKSDFRFDPSRKLIVWTRRWGFRRRSGSVPFHEVQRVVVEVPIGDSGIPSRRICLRLADGSLLPVTVGYRPDVEDRIERAAARARAILGHDTAPAATATAQELIDDGNVIAAVRLLVEKEGLTLTGAKQRVDAMKRSRASSR